MRRGAAGVAETADPRRPPRTGDGRLGAALLLAALVLAAAGCARLSGRPPDGPARGPDASRSSSAAQPSPFAIRGVVEGFYGPAWTPAATADVLAFTGARGMNTFVYAPKDDPYQRAQWASPYPPAQLADLRQLVRAARAAGVTFVYSLSPGLSIVYSSASDRAAVEAKLAQLRGIGVDTFMLSFDDVPDHLQAAPDVSAYHGSLAAAQVDLVNAVYTAERGVDPRFRLMFTPTEYWGTTPDAYLRTLAGLNPAIGVVWTGPGVLSPEVTLAQAQAFGAIVGRKPILWYNYPVNDWTAPSGELASGLPGVQPRVLFMGPVRGLAADLGSGLEGVLANPMLEARASEPALASLAAYLQDPASASAPQAAWSAALQAAGGAATPALQAFVAGESPYPALSPSGAYVWGSSDPALDAVEASLLQAYARDPGAAVASPAAAQLRAAFESWIQAVPALAPARFPDPALAAEIGPWVGWMAPAGHSGLDGLALLQAAGASPGGPALAADRAQVQRDLVLLASSPVDFGGDLSTFLEGVLAATP